MNFSITFTRDQFEAELKRARPSLWNINSTDFADILELAGKRALADLQKKYILADDPIVLDDTFEETTAPTTGTALMNTSSGDAFVLDLLANAESVRGDMIWLKNGTTAKIATRKTPEEIVLTGTDATTSCFFEVDGQIQIYIKDAEITTPADVHYTFRKGLEWPATGGAIMPCYPEDFAGLIDATLEYLPAGE